MLSLGIVELWIQWNSICLPHYSGKTLKTSKYSMDEREQKCLCKFGESLAWIESLLPTNGLDVGT